MQSQGIINVAELLERIAGDSWAGVDLRRDMNSGFYELRKNREAARRAERKEEQGLAEASDSEMICKCWGDIFDRSQNIIRYESKDLEVAAWVIEALVRLYRFHEDVTCREGSFAGLCDGFRLIQGLVKDFWDVLFPREDEGGVKTKLKPITDLNGTDKEGVLISSIRKIPITRGEPAFSTGEYLFAVQNKDQDVGKYSYDNLIRSARQTPEEFFWSLISDVSACQTELEGLAQVLREKAGPDNVHTSRLSEVLQDVLHAVTDTCHEIAGKDLAPKTSKNEQSKEQDSPGKNTSRANAKIEKKTFKPASGIGPIKDREDAFGRLLEIADYFEEREPHSPISYTLKELVRRGRLPLVELLGELIDEESRTKFLERAGIQPPKQEDKEY